MITKRRVLDYSVAGLALLLPVIILHANIKDPKDLNRFDQAVLRISSPLQAAIAWTISGIGGTWTGYVGLVGVEDENQELRTENQRLRDELAHTLRRAGDTAMLENLLGLRDRTPADSVGARVISASLNPFYRVVRMRIDQGGKAIQPGMPVINASGLVGRIHRSYGEYSDMLLLTDAQSSIPVAIKRTGARGGLRGLGKDNSGACEISRLERGKEVRKGDLVVTSGLGNVFPPGIPVGEISRVDKEHVGMFHKVEVVPAVNFSALDTVLVLIAPPPPADPSANKKDKRSPQAFGVTPF